MNSLAIVDMLLTESHLISGTISTLIIDHPWDAVFKFKATLERLRQFKSKLADVPLALWRMNGIVGTRFCLAPKSGISRFICELTRELTLHKG